MQQAMPAVIAQLTKEHKRIKQLLVESLFEEVLEVVNSHAQHTTDPQLLKIVLLITKAFRHEPWLEPAYDNLTSKFNTITSTL